MRNQYKYNIPEYICTSIAIRYIPDDIKTNLMAIW